ncbi:MAG: amidohydrolase [Candidatus Acidiferrales bacterium]
MTRSPHNGGPLFPIGSFKLLERRGSWAFLVALNLLLCTALVAPLQAQTPAPATIYIGHFLTLDRSNPTAAAVAVSSSGRILAVGSRSQVLALANESTRKITFSGWGVPGFGDGHIHPMGVGSELERLDLRRLTKPQVLAKVAAAARSAAPGSWIFGAGWDQGFWHPEVFPTAKELDAASGHHPVVLSRIDGHATWVNSRVLDLAGITPSTPNPAGGQILRDPTGHPTGILVDNAEGLIRRSVPKRTFADEEREISDALQEFARWGLTSIEDAGASLDAIKVYKDLLSRGKLPVRVYALASDGAASQYLLSTGPQINLGGNHMLTIRGFGEFVADGALGSRGAQLFQPYSDAPTEDGLAVHSDAQLEEIVRESLQHRLQMTIHAIGDHAVDRVLNIYEKEGVTPTDRFHIEHASLVTDKDIKRFAPMGIIASIQPVFIGEYSRWAYQRVGPSRVDEIQRLRDFMNDGVHVSFGTDYPASDAGQPIITLYCAVAGKAPDGTSANWYANETVTVGQALRAMTAGVAYADFEEKNLGALTVGRYADFVILSANPYNVPPNDLRSINIRMTVMGGRITFKVTGRNRISQDTQ